ncbi:MAG: ROK family protein [Turicibacter sp.]|nr:ROK family protein [Turicibacter sp.]
MNYLAIDLGGTEIKYALITKNAEILEKCKIPTPRERTTTMDDLIEALSTIISKYQEKIKGIALSLPGVLDSDTGYSYSSGALHYIAGNNLPEALQEKFNLPVTVENDAKSAALAELWKGSLTDVQNAAVVLLGTGVGGGIIIDGKLYKGKRFSAGEMSFMLSDPASGEFWGATGGSSALLRLVSEKIDVPFKELDGHKVFEMANEGDELVLSALDTYTRGIALQLYNLQSLLDLDVFAIGGGISQQPILMTYLQKHVDDFCGNHALGKYMPFIPTPKLTTCKFFNDSNLIGALYHHLNKET